MYDFCRKILDVCKFFKSLNSSFQQFFGKTRAKVKQSGPQRLVTCFFQIFPAKTIPRVKATIVWSMLIDQRFRIDNLKTVSRIAKVVKYETTQLKQSKQLFQPSRLSVLDLETNTYHGRRSWVGRVMPILDTVGHQLHLDRPCQFDSFFKVILGKVVRILEVQD